MSSSSDDDFFMASASEDEEELKNEFENVYTASMSEKKNEESLSLGDISEDSISEASTKQLDKGDIDNDPEYLEKRIKTPKNPKRMRNEDDDTDAFQNKKTRNTRRQQIDDNVIDLDTSSPLSARSSRSNSSGSSHREYGGASANNMISDDETDAFFKELSKKATPTNSTLKNADENTTKSSPKRIYNIRFLSKLEGTIDRSVRVKVLGKFTFAKIIPSALQGLTKAYKIPKVMKNIYDPKNVVLYWNKAKLLDFMTCNSLNIRQEFDNEISNVDILLVSLEKGKEMEALSMEEWLQHTSEASQKLEEQQAQNGKQEASTDLVIAEFEKELQNVALTGNSENVAHNTEEVLDVSNEEDNGVMKISLVGEDNKKLFVNVRASTPLIKLVDYFRTQKKLPQKAVLHLSFDDETLDLGKNVGDYDIEDEDMIEVVLIK